MAITQTRCEPRAREIIANARHHGHTKKEARRILKRRLSDVVYRRVIDDLDRRHTPRRQHLNPDRLGLEPSRVQGPAAGLSRRTRAKRGP
jgi:hypothetical protein